MNKENPLDPQKPLEGCESAADKPSDGFVTWDALGSASAHLPSQASAASLLGPRAHPCLNISSSNLTV